jgi:site-specific recombinase XerD
MNYSDICFQFKRYALNEKGMRPRSCKAILSCMHDLCQFARSDDLRDLQEGMIREFLHAGREEKLWSAKTYRNRWQHMSTFFDWCVDRNFHKKNPLQKIGKPKLPQNLPRCLTQEQMQTVLNTVRWMNWTYSFSPIRNEAIISTFVFTGIRLNELLNLEMSDVNIRQGEILVRQGKNRKDRIVPIHPRLRRILENYVSEKKERLQPSQWFFTSIRSTAQLTAKNVQQMCLQVSTEAKVKFTPHMLRHTFGRLCIDQDFNIYKLKEIMGHTSVNTTQIYLSLSKEGIKRSFENVEF